MFEESFLHEAFSEALDEATVLTSNALCGLRWACEVLKTKHEGNRVREALRAMGSSLSLCSLSDERILYPERYDAHALHGLITQTPLRKLAAMQIRRAR